MVEGEGAAGAGAAGAQGGAAGGAAGGTDSWYTGADAETTGFMQNRGWDKLDAKGAALAAIKSYREASAHLGAPPDQLMRMPKDANDAEAWGKLYGRLGVPDKPDGYNFDDVKFSDGSGVDQDVVNTVRSLAAQNHLTPEAAKAVAKTIVGMVEKAETVETDQYNVKLEAEKAALRQNWGGNAASNLVIAQNAAGKLGVDQETLATLEKTLGYSKVMEMFRQVGARIGEDNFLGGGNLGRTGPITQNQAKAELSAMETDTDFNTKLFSGDMQARQKFDNLTRIASGFVG